MPQYRGNGGRTRELKTKKSDSLSLHSYKKAQTKYMYRRECKSFIDKPVLIPPKGLDVIKAQKWLDGWEQINKKNGELHGRNEQG